MTILVTGAAGFVGYHVSQALLERGERVIGVDNLNAYYDPALKTARLDRLKQSSGFTFHHIELSDASALLQLAHHESDITGVLHFAAQAGVRYSMTNPAAFADSNVLGHVSVLEFARRLPRLKHLVYASSSSVYGRNTQLPFRETDRVDQPGSFYAVTKRAGELTSSTYSHLYGIPQTGLRFFTVYGPWGRPDMAYYSFARAISRGEDVTLYEGDALARDFTYIADVVTGVLAVFEKPPAPGEARVLNIGNHRPESVRYLVQLLERELGRSAKLRLLPRPDADVETTWACIDALHALTGWRPSTALEDGVSRFVSWFRQYEAR
ncbi:MAG: NAD-dependent epimerase/dehydratase family protein [Acetobacter indonesiensis]|nr:NAD-dependent epimerase/dehydratase family protein [Acetobacter indonesiensis]MCI1547062.1 NAD-dependent epimerase/dehydratase family protein [Acetobacter indonesiensis]MCI1766414.1 NAD-dependent epimerase/dehydratase family protein [Acetobacter indonesiensis]